MTIQRSDGSTTTPSSPVDDRTYNILQALTSTLESMDAYEVYASEGDDGGLFASLLDTQRQSAEQLVDALRECLVAPGEVR
ncbi:MAG: hypothetical protein U0838_05295 [Chloroflexota bacterium]